MTEEIINKKELKNLRFLLQSGQKLAISTKEFERVFDKIDRLEQENKELKAYKDINEDFKKAWDELNEKYKQLRSALEKINKIAEPRFVNGLNEEADLCNLAMDRIQNKINEVLNDK